MHAHRLAEERSLELHREIASLLERNPGALEQARERVRSWLRDGSVPPSYAIPWSRLLNGSLRELQALLVDESERARALRQVTPFAGFIDPRTRWRIWRDVRSRHAGAP